MLEEIENLPGDTSAAYRAECYYEVAIASGQLNELFKMAKAQRTAVDLDPFDPYYRLELCQSLAAQGDMRGAEDMYKQAMTLPDFADVYDNF